jgi:hypothetical protein
MAKDWFADEKKSNKDSTVTSADMARKSAVSLDGAAWPRTECPDLHQPRQLPLLKAHATRGAEGSSPRPWSHWRGMAPTKRDTAMSLRLRWYHPTLLLACWCDNGPLFTGVTPASYSLPYSPAPGESTRSRARGGRSFIYRSPPVYP